MFWRFGGYANVSVVDTLLDKPDVTLEELLDETDLIQELKQHNTKLIEYLREDKILERLLEYVIAPKPAPAVPQPEVEESAEVENTNGKGRSLSRPRETDEDEEEKEKKRNRYAYISAEILSSENWSICEALMENQPLLRKFWDFLKLPPPLDPLQASYFTKVNETLLDKKTEEMLELFKSLDGAVQNMLQHVDSPMVMDLLLKIISLEKAEGGQGIVDWLHSQDLMPILLSFLSSEHSWATQTSAGDFLKAIITISANASQNEQSCIGPNELTRQLVSQPCIEKLISDMLKGGNPLTVGVGIVIEVIRKNNSDYDPEVGTEANAIPSSRDPIYLGTLLRMFAQRIPDFMELILSPNHTIGGGDGPVTIRRKELSAAFGGKIEPLGFDRFKTCELMAELLHCSNMGLLNELGSEEFVKARDIERERLKAEGKLAISPNQLAGQDDDLAMKSSVQTRLGSPDGSRKLEIQNASDDDGFEEVTHAADLGDDAKDDFDEKPGEEDLLGPSRPAPLSFLDKDDEDFVDEPLSSPRLQNVELSRPHLEDDMMPQPLSPTKDWSQEIGPLSPTGGLSQKVGSLDLTADEDADMTSPPPSVDGQAESSEQSSADASNLRPESSVQLPEALHQEVQVGEHESAIVELVPPHDLDTLPHPEDKPAPLFAKKDEPAAEIPQALVVPEVNTSAESLDTTMGEAGDSSSVVMENTEDHQLSLMEDASTPVVGDFLKMQFVEHKVVPTILDFFFRFPWNNFLHNVVYDVVQQVFNGPMDRGYNRMLAIDLFETGNITMRIVDGQKKSDEAQKKNRMRLGYMGHLTLIAEEVVKFTERHPPELLSESVLDKVSNAEWINYVEVTLSETRERDNAILGGVRPDMSVGPRQAVMNAVNAANNFGGASSALSEAGLNGSVGLDSIDLANGNGTTGGAFTLTSGTLLSGFGSSSDEEDDEMDEDTDEDGIRNSGVAEVGLSIPPAPNLDRFDDEEADFEYLEQLDRDTPLFPKGEFSRYISTPSTTTATSSDLEPPSQPPPPPPPLNIPPSRARRQLAARLALHSKQSLLSSTNGDKSQETQELERRQLNNPFATDEDEDGDSDPEDTGLAKDEALAVGDVEAELEGRGNLPPGTGLVGSSEKLAVTGRGGGTEEEEEDIDHVGNPAPASSSSSSSSSVVVVFSSPEQIEGSGSERAKFPSLWPFGAGSPKIKTRHARLGAGIGNGGGGGVGDSLGGDWGDGERMLGEEEEEADDRGHFEGVSADFYTQSDSDSDEDFGNLGPLDAGNGGEGGQKKNSTGREGKRRLSVTTEAKRRTSLEDDDDEDEGVVHVVLGEGMEGEVQHGLGVGKEVERRAAEEGDDGEMVEIQHAEMQGVEGGK